MSLLVVSLKNGAVISILIFFFFQLKLVSVLLGGNQRVGNQMQRTWRELSYFALQCHQFTSIRKTEKYSYLKIEEHLPFCSRDASSVCCKVTAMNCVEALLHAFFFYFVLSSSPGTAFCSLFLKSYRGHPQSQQMAFIRNTYEVLGVRG